METKKEISPKSNIYDVIIALINGFFNIFKIEKIACIVILYMLYRDFYLVHKIDENTDIGKLLIDTKIIENILSSDNKLIIVLSIALVAALVTIFIFIIFVRPMYIKEIDRLTEERKYLMHERKDGKMDAIKKHKSSKKV